MKRKEDSCQFIRAEAGESFWSALSSKHWLPQAPDLRLYHYDSDCDFSWCRPGPERFSRQSNIVHKCRGREVEAGANRSHLAGVRKTQYSRT